MTTSRSTEVDGVPVLVAATPGPIRAGLVFRVGRVDESLATGGITHLVEHLALHRQGNTDYHYNAVTSTTTTQFVIQGTAEGVVSFLHGVCRNLRDLPTGRLATEKKIVETEAAGRADPINHLMPAWRYGARDYGLVSYPEWGIHTLTAAQVVDWARTRFTRGNAVLWLAGTDVPAELRLDLPDGDRWDLPAESSALPVTPAYVVTGTPVVMMDARVPRTCPAAVYSHALGRALFAELRQKQGLSYTAATTYVADGGAQATVTAVADAQPDQIGKVVDGFLAQTRALEDGIDSDELAAIRRLAVDASNDPEAQAGLLPRRATDLLTGFPTPTMAEWIQGIHETKRRRRT